ncbi:hypothetical protein BDV96DRAFT_634185 [Lophiotrema nucula]|uniref:Uncharacterized protein n=1 Tax=Lophiotrema nucula TaxID=690887 RepID=A0A6A5Z2E4_9PLEO|nr:hypothetical protein BDV96DRAFT_634185 [Lophiotrema nucula]
MPKLMRLIYRLALELHSKLITIPHLIFAPKRCAEDPTLQRREAEEQILNSLHTTLEYMQGDLTGIWTCCNCETNESIVVNSGENPLGLLSELPKEGIVWVHSDWTSELYIALCTNCGLSRRLKSRPRENEGPACVDLGLPKLNCGCAASTGVEGDCIRLKVGTGTKKYDNPQAVLRQIKEIFDGGYELQPPASTLVAQMFFVREVGGQVTLRKPVSKEQKLRRRLAKLRSREFQARRRFDSKIRVIVRTPISWTMINPSTKTQSGKTPQY